MLRLQYFPLNAAFAFMFGDALIALADEPYFHATRKGAVQAARYRGLQVSASGVVRAA